MSHDSDNKEEHLKLKAAGSTGAASEDINAGGIYKNIRFQFTLTGLILILLKFYKLFISPLLPPCCRFEPTCSVYAMQAVITHGVVKGLVLAGWRLLRCQPFAKGGYDPVPPKGYWKNPDNKRP